jgi:hypothetical protein
MNPQEIGSDVGRKRQKIANTAFGWLSGLNNQKKEIIFYRSSTLNASTITSKILALKITKSYLSKLTYIM